MHHGKLRDSGARRPDETALRWGNVVERLNQTALTDAQRMIECRGQRRQAGRFRNTTKSATAGARAVIRAMFIWAARA